MIQIIPSSQTAADIMQDFVERGIGMLNKGSHVNWVMDILRRDCMIQAIDQNELEETLREYYWN